MSDFMKKETKNSHIKMKWEILGAADEMQLDFPKLNLYTNHGSERKQRAAHTSSGWNLMH